MTAIEQLIETNAFEEFIGRPENRDRLFELIEGRIIEKLPTQEHGAITLNIGVFLKQYIRSGHPARAGVEIRYRSPDDTRNDRLPDVSLSYDVDHPRVTRGAVPRMPDFAVEIKSPDDLIKDMHDAAAWYMRNGCRLVWLVYPAPQLVEVVTTAGIETFSIDETLTGGEVLPGFEMPVRVVFED